MKGSRIASALAYGEALWWNRKNCNAGSILLFALVLFMAQKMRACGYDYTKLSVICNFIEQDKLDFFFIRQR